MNTWNSQDGEDAADSPSPVDERFLNALLVDVLSPDQKGQERRVQRVLAAIDAYEVKSSLHVVPSRRQASPSSRWTSFVAAVCVLALVIIARQMTDAPRSALATVAQSRLEAQRPDVREYEVRESYSSQASIVSRLYVSGPHAFAYAHQSLIAPGDFWLGGNERDVWLVPGRGPVLVGRPDALESLMNAGHLSTTPLLQMSRILHRLEERYDLESLPDETLHIPRADREVRCHLVRGRRLASRSLWPETIELWANAETGVATRLVLNWPAGIGFSGLHEVTFNLVDEPNLPAEWFEHGAHHDGTRSILRQDDEGRWTAPAGANAAGSARSPSDQTVDHGAVP